MGEGSERGRVKIGR